MRVNVLGKGLLFFFSIYIFSFCFGITPLFGDINDDLLLAAQEGRTEQVKELLQNGADVNAKDRYSSTPLIYAAMNGHTQVVKLLLEAGADVHHPENGGYTPLIAASAQGHLEIVKLLLSAGASIHDKERRYHMTPLLLAVSNGHAEIVRELVKGGADVESTLGRSMTALMLASGMGHVKVVQVLLALGARVERKDREGKTARDYAEEKKQSQVVQMLTHAEKRYEYSLTIIEAVQEGDSEEVLRLLEAGADINVADEAGTTAVIAAVKSGRSEILSLLLRRGADPKQKDKANASPLWYAVREGNREVVEILLSAGIDPDEEGPLGNTALIDAVIHNQKPIARLLLEAGADPRKESGDTRLTPLQYAVTLGRPEITKELYEAHFQEEPGGDSKENRSPENRDELLYTAAGEGNLETVKVLLDLGISPDTPFHDKTALMAAAISGSAAVAELLMQRGAQADTRDARGRTALMAGLRSGDRETLKVLLQGGADPGLRDNWGWNVLDLAVEFGKPELGEYISRTMESGNGIRGIKEVEVNPFYALFQAVAEGDEKNLKTLLESGAGPNVRGPGGTTPLIAAAVFGRTEAMELLLRAGAEPNTADHIGSTALAWVVKNGDLGGLTLLAEAGADPNYGSGEDPAAGLYDGSRELEGLSPLVHAVDRAAALTESGTEEEKRKAVEIVQALLDMGADPLGSIPDGVGGETPVLLEAVKTGLPEVAEALLAAGADPSVKDKMGRTSLYYAVEKGHKALAETLISRGANIHASDNTGKSILLLAIEKRRGEILDFLINSGITMEEVTKVITGFGESALFAAVGDSLLSLAKKLCDAGAKVDQLNNNEETPLILAAEQGHTEMVELLLEYGADPNRIGKFHKSPLNAAAGSGNTDLVETLIAAGAVVHNEADQGERALAEAVVNNDTDMAQLLLKHNAVPSFVRPGTGDTLLHTAAKWGNPIMVRLLLNKVEEDIAKKNKFGKTASDVAREYGFPEVENLLMTEETESRQTGMESEPGKETEDGSGNTNPLLTFRPEDPLSFLQKGKKNYASGKYQLAKLNFLEALKMAVLYWKPFKRPVEAAMMAELYYYLGKTETAVGFPERTLLWYSMALDQWYDQGKDNIFSVDFSGSEGISRWSLVDLLWEELNAPDGLIQSYAEADRVKGLTLLAGLLNPDRPKEVLINCIDYLIKPINGWLRKIYDPMALVMSLGDFTGGEGPSLAYLRQLSEVLHIDMGGSEMYSYVEADTLSDPLEVLPLFLRQLSYMEGEYPQVQLNEYYHKLALAFFYQGRVNTALYFLEKTGPPVDTFQGREYAGRAESGNAAESAERLERAKRSAPSSGASFRISADKISTDRISAELFRYLLYSSQGRVGKAYHHLLMALDQAAASGHSLLFSILGEMSEDYDFLEDLLFQAPFEKRLITLEVKSYEVENQFITFDIRDYPRLHQFRREYLDAREMVYRSDRDKTPWQMVVEAEEAIKAGEKAEGYTLLEDALKAFEEVPPQYDDMEDLLEVAEDFYFDGFPEHGKFIVKKIQQILKEQTIMGDDYSIPDYEDMLVLRDDLFGIALMILLDSDAPEDLEGFAYDQWEEFSAVLDIPLLLLEENFLGNELGRFLKETMGLFLTLGKIDRSLNFQHIFISLIEEKYRSIAFEDRRTPYWYGYPIEEDLVNAYLNRALFQTTRGFFHHALSNLVETWQGDQGFSGRNILGEKLYLNLGMLCQSWGLFEEAQGYLERALHMVSRKKDRNSYVTQASVLNNLAVLRLSFMDVDQAEDFLDQALEALEKVGDVSEVEPELFGEYIKNETLIYNNRGVLHYMKKDYKKALEVLLEGMDQTDKTAAAFMEDFDLLKIFQFKSTYMNALGAIYSELGEYDKAIHVFNKGLARAEELKNLSFRMNLHFQLGVVYEKKGDLEKAESHYKAAIRLLEEWRNTAPGDTRLEFLSLSVEYYKRLASLYFTTEDVKSALKALELYKARYLAEKVSEAREEAIPVFPGLEKIQEEMEDDTVFLVYAELPEEGLGLISVRKEKIKSWVLDLGTFNRKVKNRIEHPAALLAEEESAFEVYTQTLPSISKEGSVPQKDRYFPDLLAYYRRLLSDPLNAIGPDRRYIARELYDFLLKPAREELAEGKRVIIIPSGSLSVIPFESLIDSEGRYFIQEKAVQYSFSLALYSYLHAKKEEETAGKKPFLGFGGAPYESEKPAVRTGITVKEIEASIFSMKTRGSGERDHRLLYDRMGFTWSDLPGTVEELQGIRSILPGAEVFLGAEVTEGKLKALAEKSALKDYRVLHLAAHGLSLPSFPELSAIVLSQAAQDGEDGYLQMDEIADLDLETDLVTLSACDTAAGKIYAGEGVVGLTQSFIIAGAKNVSASLWQISDEATAEFMRGFYRLVFKEGYSYSEALREIKLRFITGREGYGRYKNPFFWASFLLYGGGF